MEMFAAFVSYLKQTGISDQEAHATAFVMAGLLADIAKRPDLAEYVFKRSGDSFSGSSAPTQDYMVELHEQIAIDQMDGRKVSANEANLKNAQYSNSYWH